MPLCTPADRPCHLVSSRLSMGAGQRPIGEDPLGGFNLIHQLREELDVFRSNMNLRLAAFRRRCHRRPNPEQRLLNLLCPCGDLLVLTDAAGKPEDGVELVYGAIGLHTQVCFRNANAAGKPGLSAISMLGRNTHWFSPFAS